MSDISENSITIEAPIDEVVAVLTDLASYPTWSTAIKSVEVQDKDASGRATKAKMSIDAGVMKDRVILDYDWSKSPAEISFALDDADLLTEMSGTYEIADNGDDTTTVKYQLTVALSMPVPAMMRQKAERAADFYLRKTGTTLNGEPFLSAAVRAKAQDDQAWLTKALSEHFEGPTVVVTHFAPSRLSSDPRYGETPGTAGFCNALDDLLPLADLWLHGHLHCAHDYRVGPCRVVANPLGYASKGEQEGFRPACVLDL